MRINGPALAAIRERSGLTQSALAKQTGISQGRISEIEKKSATTVRPDTGRTLATALAVPLMAIVASVDGEAVA